MAKVKLHISTDIFNHPIFWRVVVIMWIVGAVSYNLKECRHANYMHKYDRDEELDEEHPYTNE